MANYGVINEARVQAQNIDAFNRTAQATVDVAGGGLVALANSGHKEMMFIRLQFLQLERLLVYGWHIIHQTKLLQM